MFVGPLAYTDDLTLLAPSPSVLRTLLVLETSLIPRPDSTRKCISCLGELRPGSVFLVSAPRDCVHTPHINHILSGQGEKGERKGLVNNLTPTRIHSCIPAVSVDEGKHESQVGVSCE